MTFHVPEKYRFKTGPLKSFESDGNNGVFIISSLKMPRELKTIASDGMGFEHVSVTHMRLTKRTPTWKEMCLIKAIFWDDEDCVIQLHPPKLECINLHPYCLHLWRPINVAIPMPLKIMV